MLHKSGKKLHHSHFWIAARGCGRLSIHTSSNVLHFLSFIFLKKEGVYAVIFLNWFDKSETLL
jgi:hypothetical protein